MCVSAFVCCWGKICGLFVCFACGKLLQNDITWNLSTYKQVDFLAAFKGKYVAYQILFNISWSFNWMHILTYIGA